MPGGRPTIHDQRRGAPSRKHGDRRSGQTRRRLPLNARYGNLIPTMIRKVNADKPHLWKADIAASVDQFNEWFMRFAPEAFRSTRIKTTEHVKTALLATNDLRN